MIRLEMDEGAMLEALRERAKNAENVLRARVKADCDAYVPYDTGTLAGLVREGDGEIVYEAPYARFVYYGGGLHFRTDRHPMATAGWFETAKAANGAQWAAAARDAMRQRA